MSHRIEQVRSTLQRAVQQVLAEGLSDPRTQGALITVTDVTVSNDLKNATVLVSVLPEKKQELCLHALEHARGWVRRRASDLMALGNMPHLTFRVDLSLKRQAEVLAALNKASHTGAAANTSPAPEAHSADQEHGS